MRKNKALYSLLICLMVFGSGFLFGCSGSSSSSSGGSGSATLTGTVNIFTAALETEKKTMFAQIRDFIFSKAYAAVSGVTVSVGGQSDTTDSSGSFTVSNISTGDQTVTFTSGSSSETYSLNDVDSGETFTLNNISVSSGQVTTEHTGTWTGTITFSDGTETLTMTISANGNSVSGTMTTSERTEVTYTGTENGSSMDGTYIVVSDPDGCAGEEGTFSGTFSGTTFSGSGITTKAAGGSCIDPVGATTTITLTKS